MARDNSNHNYVMSVHRIDALPTSNTNSIILELDGQLTTRAKREIREAIGAGKIVIREKKRVIA